MAKESTAHIVGEYHERELGRLLEHVGEAIDAYRAGELDAWETDRRLFQYSRAAKKLWVDCSVPPTITPAEIEAGMIDYWQRGAPRSRG